MTNKSVSDLTSSGALTGTELFYADDGTTDVKVTANQIKTFAQGITNVQDDTSPTLGGALDGGGFNITNVNDATFDSLTVTDVAYNATTWNGDATVPTKNAIRDYLETLTGVTLPAAYQPLDADLTAIAALATSAAGRSILTFADPNADRLLWWDDSDGSLQALTVADVTEEATPGSGDFFIGLLADGSLVKVDFDNMPGGTGSGLANVSEDTSPTLGGDLEGGTDFTVGTLADPIGGVFLASGDIITWDGGNAGEVTVTHSSNLLTISDPVSVGTANAVTCGSIELGHASDTTITRVSAGVVAVEGNNVLTTATGQPLDADLTTLATAFTSASAAGAASLAFHEDTDNGTNRVLLQGPASTGDVTVTLPAAACTLVGKDTTDTLTNKTFDANGTGNALSNVEVADFAASAITTATDTIAGNDSDSQVPTTAAVIDYAQPLDSDLTAIADITTTAAGRSVLAVADDGMDELLVWDDTAGAVKTMPLADFTDEASPASGDYIIIVGAEGDVRKTNWSNLPGSSGMAILASGTLSDDATLDIALDGFSSYKIFKLYLNNLHPATDATALYLRFSDDGGLTFEADASDYRYSMSGSDAQGDTTAAQSTGATQIQLTGASSAGGTDGSEAGCWEIIIFNPHDTGYQTKVTWHGVYNDANNGAPQNVVGAGEIVAAGASTDVQILYSSGNIESGTYTLVGFS